MVRRTEETILRGDAANRVRKLAISGRRCAPSKPPMLCPMMTSSCTGTGQARRQILDQAGECAAVDGDCRPLL